MAWAALAIPIAAQLLGGSKKEQAAPQQAVQPPPTLGEIFAMNSAATHGGDNFNTYLVDPKNRGPYG